MKMKNKIKEKIEKRRESKKEERYFSNRKILFGLNNLTGQVELLIQQTMQNNTPKNIENKLKKYWKVYDTLSQLNDLYVRLTRKTSYDEKFEEQLAPLLETYQKRLLKLNEILEI